MTFLTPPSVIPRLDAQAREAVNVLRALNEALDGQTHIAWPCNQIVVFNHDDDGDAE